MPVDPVVLLAFVPAALALNLTPGADMMFCLGQGLRHGPRAAWAASAGISAGAMVQCAVAGLGLGAVMAALPWAFDLIRWIGVGYLLWLAWQALRAPRNAAEAAQAAPRAFRDGFLVNTTNPKVILFVLAFIPQFVDPGQGRVFLQFLVFGFVLALGGLAVNGLAGAFASGAGQRAARSPGIARMLNRLSAGIFGLLAVRLAVLERS